VITDNVGASATSNTAHVTVNGLPTVSITPTSATIHVGDTITFTSIPLGGTTPYMYQWYLNGAPVSGATSATWIFSQPAGSYTVYLNITDSVGARTKSNVAPVTVIELLTATISPPSASITLGHSVSFTSTVNGGVTPYYYQWYIDGSPVPGATNPAWTFTPASTGTFNVHLNVTDSMGTKAKSNIAPVIVTLHPGGVGGRSTSVNAFTFLAPWLSTISLLAAAVMLKGIITRKKRS
jgi:membrane carboxypeptidase/penicillin-binding protein PbpC